MLYLGRRVCGQVGGDLQMGEGLRVPEHIPRAMCLHVDGSCRKVQWGAKMRVFWLLSVLGGGTSLCVLALVVPDCFSHSPSKAPFRLPLCLIKAEEIVYCILLFFFWLTHIPLSPARRELQDQNI